MRMNLHFNYRSMSALAARSAKANRVNVGGAGEYSGNVPRSKNTSQAIRENYKEPIADKLKLAFSSLHRERLYMRSFPGA
jgi:hypothetical protein